MTQDRIAQVAGLFDTIAPTYDQVGVDFFVPIAEHLVSLVKPRPGESAIELGCGRGALTIPLAAAVGPEGSVRASDVSPAMVSLAREATAHLSQVEVTAMNAAEPTLQPGEADIVAASLVLFFLPDPAAALRQWIELLAPAGRIGLTTFGTQDAVWRQLDALFAPYIPATMLDARTSGKAGPFASDAGFDQLVRDCGASSVSSTTQTVTVGFADSAAWQRWTMSVGQRMMWGFVPPEEHPELLARAAELLDSARGTGDVALLHQDVRHTIGFAAS